MSETAGRIQDLLNRQISLAQTGRTEEIQALADEVEQILAHADPAEFQDASIRESILMLHQRLGLTLGAAKNEAAEQLKGINRGKGSLRAYRDAYR